MFIEPIKRPYNQLNFHRIDVFFIETPLLVHKKNNNSQLTIEPIKISVKQCMLCKIYVKIRRTNELSKESMNIS